MDMNEIIAKYLAGLANIKEKEQLLAWLKEDKENRRLFALYQNIWRNSIAQKELQNIDVDAAYKKIHKQINNRVTLHRAYVVFQRIAAILLVPLLISTIYLWTVQTKDTHSIMYQEVYAAHGTRSKIVLPDSSVVWLNSGTYMKYPQNFQENRELELKGEAYFQVQANPKNPFVVKTNLLDVMAVGTKFNVEAYPNDSLIAVSLIEGDVKIQKQEKPITYLTPNHRFVYNKTLDLSSIEKSNNQVWTAWIDGMLVFRNNKLSDVFRQIGRKYNVSFDIIDPTILDYKYHATFHNESLDDILTLLQCSAPIIFETTALGTENQQPKIIKVYCK